jgi:uncharacterized coiled-coil protein SlyX
LNRIWSDFRAAAAFHYVNLRQSRLVSFRANDPQFEPRVTALLADYRRLRQFFAQSLWVQNRLRQILYRSAFQGTTLLSFSDDLKEEAVSLERPRELVQKIMAHYSGAG